MGNNPLIVVAVIGNIVSIAFFNFFGLSVTKTQSATTRMVLDSIRTIVIWAVCLALGWEEVIEGVKDRRYIFNLLKWNSSSHSLFQITIYTIPQIIGFLFLVFGTFLYNDILIRQTWYKVRTNQNARKFDQ